MTASGGSVKGGGMNKKVKVLMDMDNSVVIVGTGDMRVINGNRKIIIKTKKKDL